MAKASKKTNDGKSKVLLVDDHPIVRQGIRMLLSQEEDMVVCGEAESPTDAIKAAASSRPDIAVVDLSLKDGSGLELIKELKGRYSKLVILVLSMRDECFYAERALRAGASGYITKEEGAEKVVEGIRCVLRGEVYLTEKMSAKMITRLVGGRPGPNSFSMDRLTDRELEVFEMIGSGMTTRDIAKKLHLSVKTIESHREHIKEKLNLANATELLKQAIQWTQSLRGA